MNYKGKKPGGQKAAEAVGLMLMCIGLLLILVAGGCVELGTIVLVGAAGIVLLVVGGLLRRAFYGQERYAEWLNRVDEDQE